MLAIGVKAGVSHEERLDIFKNMILKKIFEPNRKDLAGGWRKLHTEMLHSFCCLPSIIRVINSHMKWAGYVTCVGGGDTYRVLSEHLEEEHHRDDSGVD